MTNHRAQAPLTKHDLVCIVLIAAASLFVYGVSNTVVDVDDAYISYRYAANLVEHAAFTYNIGDATYGTTTVLWAFLLAAFSKTTSVPVEYASCVLTALFLSANLVLVYVVLRLQRMSWAMALAAGALLMVSPEFVSMATAGMETMFYVFLISVAFLLYVRSFPFWAGMVSGCVFMTRPDGLAAVCAILVVEAAQRVWKLREARGVSIRSLWKLPASPPMARILAGFLLVSVPFSVWCYTHFGRLLPLALEAKQRHVFILARTRYWILEHFVSGPGLSVLVSLLVSCAVLYRVYRRHGRALPPLAVLPVLYAVWLLVYVCAWSTIRIDLYQWYIAAMGMACTMCILLPFLVLGSGSDAPERFSYRSLIALVWVCLVGIYWGNTTVRNIAGYNNYLESVETRRKEIGLAIRDHTDPGKEVLYHSAVGIIGYYSGVFLVDPVGLVTPLEKVRNHAYPEPTLLIREAADPVPQGFRVVYATDTGTRILAAVQHSTWDTLSRNAPKGLAGGDVVVDYRITPDRLAIRIKPMRPERVSDYTLNGASIGDLIHDLVGRGAAAVSSPAHDVLLIDVRLDTMDPQLFRDIECLVHKGKFVFGVVTDTGVRVSAPAAVDDIRGGTSGRDPCEPAAGPGGELF